MLVKKNVSPSSIHCRKINDFYRVDELILVKELIKYASLTQEQLLNTQKLAEQLAITVREKRKKSTGIDSFLSEYSLASEEGIALMCLAEALLRVPDSLTIDDLIKDKISGADWGAHNNQSDSLFVNATTWALLLTGKVLSPEMAKNKFSKAFYSVLKRSGEGVVRKAVEKAMRIMSKQFVTGRTIDEALKNAQTKEATGYLYSYDMLGEAALTKNDAARYFDSYMNAINKIGGQSYAQASVYQRPGISIKLSALHPRYEEAQTLHVMSELPQKLLHLAQAAKSFNIPLTIDAEESERLELSLDVIEAVFLEDSLAGWDGFGLAVQSYQKRAFFLLDWIAELARSKKRRIMVRLIKGAYWDSEIKKTQMQGLSEYPVFTRKVFTDVSFQACVKKIATMTDVIFPLIATHNAYSVAMVIHLFGAYRDYEFQCLHGMGNELYSQIVPKNCMNIPCRIYAPVGSHEDLLPYLVRRLLENGANSSFVNRIVDEQASVASLIENPLVHAQSLLDKINKNIPLPKDIYYPRINSQGLDLSDRAAVLKLQQSYAKLAKEAWLQLAFTSVKDPQQAIAVFSPQNATQLVGYVKHASYDDAQQALESGEKAFYNWSKTSVQMRAQYALRLGDLLELHQVELLSLLCLEAGKTCNDGIAEVREAVDFCRYYAEHAVHIMSEPISLRGYTGETNLLSLHPRGVVLCISPWNFPLAIFVGQIIAALVTGNCVIAKPAEQTSLIAAFTMQLFYKAGFGEEVVQLLPGKGELIGAALVEDWRVKAVVFTGSTQTAHHINKTLAAREREIIPLIAETGGQNAMIVDSSALLEQVVTDVINSAFGSAGQRCSALRVVYVPEEVYARFIELLKGCMDELKIDDPLWLSTDIGPVIDADALTTMRNHVAEMSKKFTLIHQCLVSEFCDKGFFMPPTALEIDSISSLEKEIFGPVLHVIPYLWKNIDTVIKDINNTGYGLTMGIHSRINQRVKYIKERLHVGNCYVNRNMIGAVVGLQPFGGEGLSGTGPKAGGPNYLVRFCHERTTTVDTTAAGGNASLMTIAEE